MAHDLHSPEGIAEYLNEAFETGDGYFIASAIGDAARAHGMKAIAEKVRLERSSLYRSLKGEISPGFDTIMRVLTALDIQLFAKRRPRSSDE